MSRSYRQPYWTQGCDRFNRDVLGLENTPGNVQWLAQLARSQPLREVAPGDPPPPENPWFHFTSSGKTYYVTKSGQISHAASASKV